MDCILDNPDGPRKNPALTPWPPGVDWRIIFTGGQWMLQLRPGALTPPDYANTLARFACDCAFHYGRSPCLN